MFYQQYEVNQISPTASTLYENDITSKSHKIYFFKRYTEIYGKLHKYYHNINYIYIYYITEYLPQFKDLPIQLPSSHIIFHVVFSPIILSIQLKVTSVPSGKFCSLSTRGSPFLYIKEP